MLTCTAVVMNMIMIMTVIDDETIKFNKPVHRTPLCDQLVVPMLHHVIEKDVLHCNSAAY